MKRGGIPGQGKRGQAPHVPTEASRLIVRKMMAAGYRWEEIATNMLDISSYQTLKKYYSEEMQEGRETCLFNIAQSAFRKALDEDKDMIKFCLLSKGGWSTTKEKAEPNVTTIVINGNPQDD